MKTLRVEVQVCRTFNVEGESYEECWETFKRELDLIHPDGCWEMPSKLDRGRRADGTFMDEQLTEHIRLREFTQHHAVTRSAGIEFYADNEECPGCECFDTIQFELRKDGRLNPVGRCSCNFVKLFCVVQDEEWCKKCSYRLLCLETNGGN